MEHMGRGNPSANRIASRIACLACGALSTAAMAFIDPPVLVPEYPVAGQTIAVSIHHGECDGFRAKPPQITQVGNAIHMLLESSHYDDIVLCNDPIFTAVFTVGAFPVGTYTLHVERVYDTGVPAPVYETLANFEFTVLGGTVTALPATGAWGALLLVVAILIATARKHRASHLSASALFLAFILVLPSVARVQ